MEVVSLPVCPRGGGAAAASGPLDSALQGWLEATAPDFDAALRGLLSWHGARVAVLDSAAAAARSTLWWPFTQHASARSSPEPQTAP